MSTLTPCNYCNLRSYKRHAREQGKMISLRSAKSEDGFAPNAAIDVFMHDPLEEPSEKNWCGWFMELTDYCCC